MARKIKYEKQPSGNPASSPTVPQTQHPLQEIPSSSDPTVRNSDFAVLDDMDTSDDTAAGAESLNMLGRGVKKFVQAVQDLRHLGVEDLVLPLPKIVVVGDQSTGKSSLIEAMSEIKVPRDTGTCTRCPIEINLAEGSDEWCCKVSIHQKYIYTGQLGSSKTGKHAAKLEAPTRKRPLGPWMKQETEEYPFATIKTGPEVEHVLFLAQLAILNPGDYPLKYSYAPGKPKPPKTYQVKFSPNVIRLDICGRGLPNLSFTDLPGVINVPDDPEETYLVDLVKNLVREYVCAEDCINLLAIPMSDDPANSTASRLIRDLKADGRTVGCITKPDRFEADKSPEQWVKILQGEQFILGFGYFVIKNNSNTNVDHAIARAEETAFFNEEELWADTLQAYHERFGTLQLQTFLSRLLTNQIQKSLPRIQEQVQCKASYIDSELKALPEAVGGNLSAVVAEELGRFSIELQKHIDGGSQERPFQTNFHNLATDFRERLAKSKPILILRDSSSPSRALPTRETPNVSNAGTPCPAYRPRAPQDTTGIINLSDDEDTPNSPQPYRSGSKRANQYSLESPSKVPKMDLIRSFSEQAVESKVFTLPVVRKIIQGGYISLPGQVDPKAIEKLIFLSMEHWSKHLEEFFALVKTLCKNTVFEQIRDVFGHRLQTRYFEEILKTCNLFLEEAFEEQSQTNQRLLSWELSKPKTMNEMAMDLALKDALKLLTSQRRKILAQPFLDEQEERSGKRSSGALRDEKLARVPDNELVQETFLPELKAVAETKAYYAVAFSRFVDNLCISIHCELFIKCREKLVPCLKQKFGILEPDANERLAVLLAANAQDEMRRAVLNKEKATIAQALEQLRALA